MPEFSYLFYDRAALLYGLSFLGSSEKGKKRNLGRQPVVTQITTFRLFDCIYNDDDDDDDDNSNSQQL
uniref:Uncharacterized protein n=1 Tax=Glossina palpalis gambiensis TaxID=67801 RepID=A0A1B0BNS6_9MUSC